MTEMLAFDFEHDGVVSYPARAYITTRDVSTFPAARASDPETSHEAAAGAIPRASALEHAILTAFSCFSGGMSDDRLAELLAVDWYGPTVRTARSRLSRRGLLVDSGRRGASARGRAVVIWRLA